MGTLRIKPGPAGCEARTLSLCYADPPAQWSTEPSGGAKIGKFKFKFLVRIWVIGCAMNLSGQDNEHLLYTKGWESARFLFDSDTGFLFFLETPESLTNPSQILLT